MDIATAQNNSLISVEQQRALAEVQSAMTIAKRFPRDEDAARDKIIAAASRPKMAESACYEYPKGGAKVEGASIRLAEMAAQKWGNIEYSFRVLSTGRGDDGVGYSEVESFAWDMETNSRKSIKFRVRHYRNSRKGGYQLTDDREIYELIANHASRRLRNCILAVIPDDIIDDAVEAANDALVAGYSQSTEQRAAAMAKAFAEIGVDGQCIYKFLGAPIESVSPRQLARLKRIYQSITDGISSPSQWFDGYTQNAANKTGLQAVRERRTAKKNGAPADKTEAPAAPSVPGWAVDWLANLQDMDADAQAKTIAESTELNDEQRATLRSILGI